MNEEVFRYGEHDRGFGMVTLPSDTTHAPVAVALNAGLIHREGPYRLNVLICRALARLGYISIRVDLSGKGDTPAREGLSNRESVALDWRYIKQSISERFGPKNLVLMGLCSGADNAIKITAEDAAVRGMVLLDPVSLRDAGFATRALMSKICNPYKWLHLPITLVTRARRKLGIDKEMALVNLRDEPTDVDVERCFNHIARRSGKVLAVFTNQALPRYNQEGQFVRALSVPGLDECCQEVFWPLVEHLFPVEAHRNRLVDKIAEWAGENMGYFQQELP